MNALQENVANKVTLKQGNYELQITSGSHSYSSNEETGEPAVLLWIYGEDGSTFINQETGVETGATWASLNGYYQKLKLEVKQQIVVCALFFKVGNQENSGAINLTVSSDRSDFQPRQLAVDSQSNAYSLDGQYLTKLKQWDNNFVELEPGNYRLKIKSANASYWSEEQKFDLEPWALIWIKAGSFITKLTGIETDESWCSLNSFKDEFILEVKTKTTVSGLFFDTYKEDNQGQIVVSIESFSQEAFEAISAGYRKNLSSDRLPSVSQERKVVSSSSGTTQIRSSSSESTQTVTAGSSSSKSTEKVTAGSRSSFNFRFDEAQMESMWREMAAKIETSVTVSDEQDEKKEAYYWDNLEKWILKGYQSQAKELAMQVARLEFMMKSITQQMETSFNQNFQAWSGHFDERLNNLISTRITTIVDEQVNRKLNKQTQDVKKLVVEKIQGEVDQRIDTIVNLKVANLSQEIKTNSLEQIEADLNKRIASSINLNIEERSTKINEAVINSIQADIDERVSNLINLKITEQGQETKKTAVAEIQADLGKRIDAVVNLKLTDLTTELNDRIIQQIQGDVDGRINNVVNLKVGGLSQDIKKSSLDLISADIESIKADIDKKITENISVTINENSTKITNTAIENIQSDMDERVSNVVNLRISDRSSEIKQQAISEIQKDLDKRIGAVVDLKVTDITPEINNLVVNEIQANVDKRIDAVVNLKTKNLPQGIKSLVIQQIQPDIERQITSVVGKSTENNVQVVANNIMGNIDDRIQVNFDNKILNFRNDVTTIVRDEINDNNEAITTTIFSDITNQEFFLNMESIKSEVDNFYARLGQFETRLYSRIEQGDTQLYNWTLEQLTALQGCLSDRQTLSDMFESFAAKLRNELDGAPCVQPTRFTPMKATLGRDSIPPAQPQQLPGK